ncbi:methionyl-tRNA formyltransferase [Mycoplasma nasistruthionis]|uniref:Methionyl-tRNA formyltransferase n=1 Tax=Mycoplasma nasistruthionis TaxID=353852 RepID=A0A5B7XUS6_9MOLU|nr:methionyl-tRNA formyltransferase [Mycoplasma nasistruthionis]QCZ36638.1 methionyl-tRNA formyltransferase [Mycoplasma nasistruthionis]
MKIVLAGTPDFAVKPFEAVINNFEVVAIVSQPDRPANRGYTLKPTPTKLLAQKYNIPLFQPEKIGDIYQELQALDFDILLTCAFGQYIPEKVLNLPKKCAINIHGSLLPKYRGAAPIQYSLLNGDKQTGLSLIYMTKQMDAGAILKTASIAIDDLDTSDSLFVKLSELASANIVSWLKDIETNNFTETIQDQSLVTLSPKLSKEDAYISFETDKTTAFNKIRAFSSNPGAYVVIDSKRVKIYYASLNKVKNALILKFSDGELYATDYQYETKKRVKII